MVYRGRYRTFGLITSLLLLLGLAATVVAPGVEAATAYSPPSDSWSRFQSDLNAPEGQATGSGVTIALLSTGADPTIPGLAGKVANGPDYIFAPQVSEANTLGTALAAFLVGEPGISTDVVPDARILVLRTEPDDSEPGALSFFDNPPDEQQIDAKAIRYAVGHGAQVILVDYESNDAPEPQLLSAVSYALSKNVVLVAPAAIAAEEPQSSQYVYPEGLPGVIGISQVMLPGGSPPQPANLQNENNSVLISGPADDVPASASFDLQNFGTAMGYVTGTVALIKQRFPNLSPALAARALAMSARYHPSGGYSTAYGFGVLDPNDAIIDAGTLARLTPAAAPGAPGVVSAGAHFGTPPGVISALPPVGAVAYLYWALIAVGAGLFVTGVVLLVRRRRSPARSRQGGGAPPQVPTFVGQPSPGQPFPGQPYQSLPVRQPAYPTRPNWSPLPPPSPGPAPWEQAPPSPGHAPWEQPPPSPGHAPWEQPPPSPGHAPWEQPPPSPGHAPWEPPPPSPAPPSPGPPSSAPAPWEPAPPPPPDRPESGQRKGWFDPR